MSKILSITVTVGRTVQLRPYEPYNVSASATMDVTDLQNNAAIDLAFAHLRSDLEAQVDNACTEARHSAIEEPVYR